MIMTEEVGNASQKPHEGFAAAFRLKQVRRLANAALRRSNRAMVSAVCVSRKVGTRGRDKNKDEQKQYGANVNASASPDHRLRSVLPCAIVRNRQMKGFHVSARSVYTSTTRIPIAGVRTSITRIPVTRCSCGPSNISRQDMRQPHERRQKQLGQG